MNILPIAQTQYISEWHDSFVNHIEDLLNIVGEMENHPSATEEDKKGFIQIKELLHGWEVLEIERSLAGAFVKQDVLDKIEKLHKDLVDTVIDHLATDVIVKLFLKKLTYYQIEQNKRFAELRLRDLQLLK